MDNNEQIIQILLFKEQLCRNGTSVDLNTAANIWIEKYAAAWRETHPRPIQ